MHVSTNAALSQEMRRIFVVVRPVCQSAGRQQPPRRRSSVDGVDARQSCGTKHALLTGSHDEVQPCGALLSPRGNRRIGTVSRWTAAAAAASLAGTHDTVPAVAVTSVRDKKKEVFDSPAPNRCGVLVGHVSLARLFSTSRGAVTAPLAGDKALVSCAPVAASLGWRRRSQCAMRCPVPMYVKRPSCRVCLYGSRAGLHSGERRPPPWLPRSDTQRGERLQ